VSGLILWLTTPEQKSGSGIRIAATAERWLGGALDTSGDQRLGKNRFPGAYG
jgi:hypothetical protein